MVQPALWAVMVSLAAVWQAAGVVPDAVAGHSQGEIAAACVAGILSLEDAAQVVALRSRALAALAGRGGMVSVAEPAGAVAGAAGGVGGTAVGGGGERPGGHGGLRGPGRAGGAGGRRARPTGVRARVLPVDYASHSAQVEQIRRGGAGGAGRDRPGPGAGPDGLGDDRASGWPGPELDAGYWYASLRAPVQFDRAVRALAGAGHRVFIEVSPHPVLTAAITATLEDGGAAAAPVVTGTLRRDDGGPARLLASLAEVHVRGVAGGLGRGAGRRAGGWSCRRTRSSTRPIGLCWSCSLEIYLVDGTYELFRHYYALPSAKADGREVAAVRGVLAASVLGMMKGGATHIAVATDHVIESFRNELWPGYKTGEGIDPPNGAGTNPWESPHFSLMSEKTPFTLEPGIAINLEPYGGEVGVGGFRLENNLITTVGDPEIYTTYPFDERFLDDVHPLDRTTGRTSKRLYDKVRDR